MGIKKLCYRDKLFAYILATMLIGFKASSLPEHVTAQPPQDVWLNVFVHGIMSIKPHISWNNFMLFLKDEIAGTLYEKTVELMREDEFFFRNQAMQQIGFHRIDPLLFEGNASASTAFVLEEISKHYGIDRKNYYYTYGWTGLLSAKSRFKDAKKLFLALEQEVKRLRAENLNPRIRLMGYSHGGNVNLNIAAVRQKEFPHSSLVIDEVVNIGTPVITDSDFLINDPMFKRIFHLYSMTDRVQPLDFFAPKQFFSDRMFRPRKGFMLPNKLIQIQLKVTRCKNNVTRDPNRFLLSKNLSNPTIVYGKKGLLRDMSPGHVELWFFGWTPLFYRKNYPLYPLPTIAFAPVIMHHAEQIAKTTSPEYSIVADIRPQHNVILFRKSYDYQVHSTVSYLPADKLQKMHDAILQCKPELYSNDIYKAHIHDAARNAQQLINNAAQNVQKIMENAAKDAQKIISDAAQDSQQIIKEAMNSAQKIMNDAHSYVIH